MGSVISECEGIMAADGQDQAAAKAALNETLKEYIAEWRKTREKEEEELKKLKEKQAKRKEIRAEQEKKLNQQKKEEEEKLRKEENEKKAKEAEEKKKRLGEAEAKRQEMLEAQKAGAGADKKKSAAGGAGGDARREMSKTKEQLEEEKKIALSIRLKPLELDALDSDELKAKATEIHNIIIQLETDKYDYEQRRLTQELDLKELKERQKAQLRQKALKKGLDPEPMMIGRSCTKVAGRSSEQSLLMLSGKRSMRNGPRGHPRNFPSGLVRGQARRLEMLRLLKVRKRAV